MTSSYHVVNKFDHSGSKQDYVKEFGTSGLPGQGDSSTTHTMGTHGALYNVKKVNEMIGNSNINFYDGQSMSKRNNEISAAHSKSRLSTMNQEYSQPANNSAFNIRNRQYISLSKKEIVDRKQHPSNSNVFSRITLNQNSKENLHSGMSQKQKARVRPVSSNSIQQNLISR